MHTNGEAKNQRFRLNRHLANAPYKGNPCEYLHNPYVVGN